MNRRAVLNNRERLLAVVPAAALAAAQAAHAQVDLETSVVRLGVPDAARIASSSRTEVSRQALIAMQRGRHQARIREAVAAMNWQEVLAATEPTASQCPDGLDLWARGSALHALHRARDLENYYSSVVLGCSEQDVLKQALEHAAYQLDVTGRFQIHATAMEASLDGEAALARDALLRAAIDARITDHIDRGEWSDAIRIAEETSDRDKLIQVGWDLIERDAELARNAFGAAVSVAATESDPEARYGHALAAYRLGDLSPALSYDPVLGRDPDSYEARGAELAAASYLERGDRKRREGDWAAALEDADRVRTYGEDYAADADTLTARTYLASANAAYEAEAYEDALEMAGIAAMHPETARDGALRAAWATLQLGDHNEAARAFRDLYSDAPDEESAQGLVLASANIGKLDVLGPLAKIAGGPLGFILTGRKADDAFARDDFTTAHDLAPERHPELEDIDEPWISQSLVARSARAAPGEGRVRGLTTRSSIGWSRGTSRFEAGIAAVSASSGQAPATAAVGTPGQANNELDVEALSPFLRYDTEGPLRLSAIISTTPIGGAVAPRLTGSIEVERRSNRLSLTGGLFSKSIDETITSHTGRTDPATGLEWGRVVNSGVEGNVRYGLNHDWTITAGVAAAVVTGKNVADNATFRIETGAAKSFHIDGFEYLSVGPFYQLQSFDQNTNFHTVGHGGYFSPQEFHRAGVGLNLQTEEKRKWIARLDAAIAHEQISTDPAAILPLTDPTGPQFSGEDSSGVSLSTTVNIARQLSERWILSAGASATASKAYDDVRGGLSLRYTFGKRKAVVSRDLQPNLFNRDIW